jgi:penicillin-binding protein 2
MIEPDQRSPPMTPQLALRVAIVGSIALVFFALIFFRLWFLQVLSGSEYVADAQSNITRTVPVAAPRGEILASDGSQLVSSTPVPAVEIAPPDLLPTPLTYQNFQSDIGQDDALFNKLAKVLRMSTKPQTCKYTIYLAKGPKNYYPKLAQIPCLITQSIANEAYANVTIKTDVTTDVQAYLAERQLDFPGVIAQQEVYLRSYPHGSLGAQMFGTVGPITTPERKIEAKGGSAFKGAKATDVVGQTGLEYEYDQYLLGIDGTERVKVNAANQFEGYAKETQPTPGYNLKTSLDLKLEQVGDKALQQAISDNPPANSGAFLAMDPDNGQIYAMGSLPSYNANIFTHPISNKTYAEDFGPNSNYPQLNRAIGTALPDGSTFKVITATAALQSGVLNVNDSTYDGNTEFCFPGEDPTTPGACLRNSGGESYGAVDLQTAIQDSVDTYFYHLGYELNYHPTLTFDHPKGGVLQEWAGKFGIGEQTGVDLPGEASGTEPTPAYLKNLYQQELECEAATGIYSYSNSQGLVSATPQPGYHRRKKHPASKGGCEISNYDESYWTVGDNVNNAVGQGDVQVTPLQLAVVYAALANGGTIVTPRIGEDVQTSAGDVVSKFNAPAKRHLDIDPVYLDAIRQGLRLAATAGTSADVMGNFPLPVYGKTGTAQLGTAEQIATNTETDDAWYACFVPASATVKRPIVIVVSVEKGGFGDVAAAPVARQMLSQWFLGKPGPFKTGSSKDT